MEVDAPTPRWSQTPPELKAPFSIHPRSLEGRSVGGRHDVNKDPRKLDDMYTKFLGPEGPQLLSEETKWLAVTHKSFDHARRGFNERLAFIGT
jgi:large subunit ribosomal protein L15